MRIYLDNLWLTFDIKKIEHLLDKKENLNFIYSHENIHVIQNNKLYKLDIHDGDVTIYENYFDSINLNIDSSIIKKSQEFVSHIPNNHTKIEKNIYYYKLRDKSPLSFVLEYVSNKIVDFYFILDGYHAKYSNADLNNISIKEDFEEFLEIINSK